MTLYVLVPFYKLNPHPFILIVVFQSLGVVVVRSSLVFCKLNPWLRPHPYHPDALQHFPECHGAATGAVRSSLLCFRVQPEWCCTLLVWGTQFQDNIGSGCCTLGSLLCFRVWELMLHVGGLSLFQSKTPGSECCTHSSLLMYFRAMGVVLYVVVSSVSESGSGAVCCSLLCFRVREWYCTL